METLTNKILKQGRTLLFSFIELMPFYLAIVHFASYFLYTAMAYYGYDEEKASYQMELIDQVCEVSLASLILMLLLSAKWRRLSKLSYACLVAWWLLNTVYIATKMQADIYFHMFSLVIFITFAILTLCVLTKRTLN